LNQTTTELTFRSILLGIVLSIVLAAANVYLGLKVGMTVSASIPAAVVSMGLLRLLRRSNILENNQVQTAASAGESLAAGVIFTFPALLLLGYWDRFSYAQVTLLALCGGILGVVFSVPLRRVLLAQPALTFPEGVATAHILRAGHETGRGITALIAGCLWGGFMKMCQSGFHLLAGSVTGGMSIRGGVYGAGCDLSVALLAVGYIVRLNIAVLVFAGGALAWGIAIPIYSLLYGAPTSNGAALTGYDAAIQIWSSNIRYLGVGAMLVGGLWALVSLAGPIRSALKIIGGGGRDSGEQRDTPGWVLLIALAVSAIVLPFLYRWVLSGTGEEAGFLVPVLALAFALIAGFLFSAVAGYMAGLVGSSNNPVSGVTIATILLTALCMLAVTDSANAVEGAAAAILVGAVVCCAAAISGDNLQDLKTGQIVGATPWRQQIMQILGVFFAALTLAPVLNVLYDAYGFGDMLPRADMDPSAALSAPQATLMKSVAAGVFAGDLPWGMVSIGAGIAVLIIIADQILKARDASFRMPVLAVAVGVYLPIELTVPIALGGLLAGAAKGEAGLPVVGGLLFASGLIAGEALAGIGLAGPFAMLKSTDVLSVDLGTLTWIPNSLGLIAFAATALIFGLLRAKSGKRTSP
jgi:putative OPT family oligopeptide transporter